MRLHFLCLGLILLGSAAWAQGDKNLGTVMSPPWPQKTTLRMNFNFNQGWRFCCPPAALVRLNPTYTPPVSARVKEGSFPQTTQGEDVMVGPHTARYVCLEASSSQTGTPFASVAELWLLDPQGKPLPRNGWTIAYADSEEPGSGDVARNAIDDKPETKWHTRWISEQPAPVWADDATPLWAQEQKDLRITPPTRPIPATFFCTHAPMLGKQQGAVSPPLTPSDVKGWPGAGYRVFGGMPPCDWTPERTRVLGAGCLSWGGVEYVKGEWRWEMTDPGINTLFHNLPRNNAGLLVNLKSIPPWAAKDPMADGLVWAPQIYRGCSSVPADMKDWENYVTRLATRYKGRIKYYETPNEANHEMKLTPQQILENNRVMYRAIKRVDPNAVVVGPATAGTPTMAEWTGEYMAIGGKDITDIVSCHFYGQPEAIPYMYGRVKAELRRAGAGDKPLWNSESGYLADSNEASGADKNLESRRAKTVRAFLLQWALGIQRWYVFGDVNSPGMKQAIEQTETWMTGAVMTRCEVKNLVWECEFKRKGRRFLIAWAGPKYPHQLDEKLEYPDHAIAIVPNGFGHLETLSGERKTITGNAVSVSPTPVMLSP